MAEAMEIDEVQKQPSLKQKKEKLKFQALTSKERESKLKALNEELDSLFNYFDEVMSTDLGLGFGSVNSLNAFIAVSSEEKRCSYSKLVEEIYEKVKERYGGVSIANVKSSLLYVGQRVCYGVSNSDVDVLEDETRSCLWCWETRDMKFLPSHLRGTLKVRRTCRKKINERITAILDMISTLQKSEDNPIHKVEMTKTAEKLNKVLTEAEIRCLVESLNQKNNSKMTEKEEKKKETQPIKEFVKNKREVEKEKKRIDRELQKEKLHTEKEMKRLQQEVEREEKRRGKEESEVRKQLKRKKEETEREQRRKEKQEAQLKKQLSIQKQASIMERFLKKSKTSSTTSDHSQKLAKNPDQSREDLESVSRIMDSALQQREDFDVDEIRRSHLNSWRSLGRLIRSNHRQCWGLRQKPKVELIKELKLTSNNGPLFDDDLWIVQDGTSMDDKSCHANTSTSLNTVKHIRRKQLLQFDKSCRPAFYGLWPKKSCVVGPRNPLKKDPDLEYDIDSDEEWEEEEPGESLSDSEKEEEDNSDEVSLNVDDEESEDDFFVPDGYLSENEGVEIDRSQGNPETNISHCPIGSNPEVLTEEHLSWIRQQKYLHNMTEHALRKNQPLIIVNVMHDKTHLLSAQDLTGTLKIEQMCLQALSIRAFPDGCIVEIPCDDNLREQNQEACTSNSKSGTVTSGVAMTIPDSDLPKIVSVIQSCPQGINRVLESLQQSFPNIPKTHLRSKVREISEFIGNQWKVKRDILNKLGMSTSPGGTCS